MIRLYFPLAKAYFSVTGTVDPLRECEFLRKVGFSALVFRRLGSVAYAPITGLFAQSNRALASPTSTNTMLRHLFCTHRLPLLLCASLLTLASVTPAQTINSVTVSGNPSDMLPKDGTPVPYTLTIKGTGDGWGSIKWSVLDSDFLLDETLVAETTETAITPGAWTIITTFYVWANGGKVTGSAGSCDEGSETDPAEVYVLVEDAFGLDLSQSAIRYMYCCEDLVFTAIGVAGGVMKFTVDGELPSVQVGLVYSFGLGAHKVHLPFADIWLATRLSPKGFQLANILTTDAAGQAQLTINVPPQAAGKVFVQAIGAWSNCVSNVIAL